MIINDLSRGKREELIIVAAVFFYECLYLKFSLISDIASIVSRGEIRQSITLH